MANSTDTLRLIENLEAEYGKDTADKLVSYIDMVLERNEHINLTAVRDRDEAMQKHLADSLSITDLPEYRAAQSVIDVGTGAGFPGAVLAIADPDKHFILLNQTVHARAEEISGKPDFNSHFDLCVSRAVASLDKLVGWCLPFVRNGGCFIAYKGENYAEELETAKKSLKKYKGHLERAAKIDTDASEISGHILLVIRKG